LLLDFSKEVMMSADADRANSLAGLDCH